MYDHRGIQYELHPHIRSQRGVDLAPKAFALGIGCRFGLHVKPDAKGLYITEYLLVILSVRFAFPYLFQHRITCDVQPCAFIAANYILLGRLARYLGGGKHLLVSPRRITITFVMSDVTTFLIQVWVQWIRIYFPMMNNDLSHACPSPSEGLSPWQQPQQKARSLVHTCVSHPCPGIDTSLTRVQVFLGALIAQLISFLIFTYIFLRFLYRVYRFEHNTWTLHCGRRWYSDWRVLAAALGVSCVGIIVCPL